MNTKHTKLYMRIINLVMICSIVISFITFGVSTVVGMDAEVYRTINIIDKIILVVFTMEFAIRLLYFNQKNVYIFSFNGIIDLLSITLFYATTGSTSVGVMLRIVRIVSLSIRLLKLTKYTATITRLYTALAATKEELLLFIVMTTILLFGATIGIYHFESIEQPEQFGTLFDCFWWAIITLTTIGYGDVYPITTGGKIFTSGLAIMGIGIIAVPTSIFAAALSTSKK